MNVSAKDLTSFGIGGPCRYLIDVDDQRSLATAIKALRAHRIKWFLLGKGTNLLIGDRGFNGAMLRFKGDFARTRQQGSQLICGSAVPLRRAAFLARTAELSGLEFASGIPGTVGGSVRGNAGAFGKSIGALVEKVWIMNKQMRIRCLGKKDLRFSYRSSNLKKDVIILKTLLRLTPGKLVEILAKEKKFKQQRKMRQPWGKSAGSIFKNPKTAPAGKLIEDCGLKGARVGDAIVSTKHANFILNLGNATCADVLQLIKMIKEKVYQVKRVRLKEEIITLK